MKPSLRARFVAGLLRRRGLALAVLALVFAGVVAGALRLRLDFSSTAFYGDASEDARRLRAYQATWGDDDDVLLVLIGADEGTVLAKPRLEAIAALREDLLEHEDVVGVVDLAQHPLAWSERAQTLDRLPDAARRAALADVPIVPRLLSADATLTVVAVELRFSSDDVMRTKLVVDELEAALSEHDAALAEVGLSRNLAGVPAIRASFFSLVVRDQSRFVPAMLALIGLALFAVFRRPYAVLVPALAAGVPTAMLVGAMGWLGEPIGLLNQAYFTLLPVIAVADAIHLLARHAEERRADVPPPTPFADLGPERWAIVRATEEVGLACLLTTVTTAAGFASLGVASMPILRGFGLYAALGVGLAFATVMTLVPLLLSFVVEPARVPERAPIAVACGRLACRRPGWVIAGSLALAGLSLLPASRVTIDNTLSGLLEPEHPTSQASARVDAELGGVLELGFDIRTSEGPLASERVADFETWLAEQPMVRHVAGPSSPMAAISPSPWIAPGNRRYRVQAGLPDRSGKAFVAFADRAEAEARARLGPDVEVHATGTALLAYRGVNGITTDLRRSFMLVFAVVTVVLAMIMRSPWAAALGLLPNGLPLLLGYAFVAALGGVLDPLAAVILTLGLGIAVDDSLHLLTRIREELRAPRVGTPEVGIPEAIERAVQHTGRTLAITSVILAGGLALNLGSSFPPLQMLGALGSAVIVLALAADLLVIPALVTLLAGRGLR